MIKLPDNVKFFPIQNNTSIFSPSTELSLSQYVNKLIEENDNFSESKSTRFNINAQPFNMTQPGSTTGYQYNHRNNGNDFEEAIQKFTAFALNATTNSELVNWSDDLSSKGSTCSESSSVSSSSTSSSDMFGQENHVGNCFSDQVFPVGRKITAKSSFSTQALPQQKTDVHNTGLSTFLNHQYQGIVKEPLPPIRRPHRIPEPWIGGRQIRGSMATGVTVQSQSLLNLYVEKASAQLRFMEKDRKKVELELSRVFSGKKFSSSNQIPGSRLRQNPSRLDRLLGDMCREQAKLMTLLTQMEHISGLDLKSMHEKIQLWLELVRSLQSKRNDELLCITLRDTNADYQRRLTDQILLDAEKLYNYMRGARSALWQAYSMLIYEKKNEANPESRAMTRSQEPRGENLYPAPPAAHHLLSELFTLYNLPVGFPCGYPNIKGDVKLAEEPKPVEGNF